MAFIYTWLSLQKLPFIDDSFCFSICYQAELRYFCASSSTLYGAEICNLVTKVCYCTYHLWCYDFLFLSLSFWSIFFFPSQDWWNDLLHGNNFKELDYSGKMVLLLDILTMSSGVGDKVLVFSQSIPTLDLIELYLSRLPRSGKRGKFWKKGKDWYRWVQISLNSFKLTDNVTYKKKMTDNVFSNWLLEFVNSMYSWKGYNTRKHREITTTTLGLFIFFHLKYL